MLKTTHWIGLAVTVSALAVLPRAAAVDVARPLELLLGLLFAALVLGGGLLAQRRAALGPAGWALLCLVLWAALRLPGTTDTLLARERLGCLALLVAAFLAARGARASAGPRAARTLATWLVLAAMGVAAVGLVGLLELGPRPPAVDAGASTFGTRNLAAGFVALAVPLALPGVRTRRPVAHLLAWSPALTLCLYLALAGNRLALLATTVSLLVLGALALRAGLGRRPALGVLALGALLAIAVAPRLPAPGSSTVIERLHLSRVSLAMAAESPVVGQGTGQWAVHYPRVAADRSAQHVRPTRLDAFMTTAPSVRGYRQPAHAHQDLLQLMAELGLVGAFLFLFALGAGIGQLFGAGARGGLAPRGAAGVLVFGILGLGSFPLASAPCALALGVLLALALPAPAPSGERSPRAVPAASIALLCALLTGHAIPRVAAEAALARGVRAAERGDRDEALSALFRAEVLAPDDVRVPHYRTWVHATARETGAARAAAERALALRPHAPSALNDLALCLRREGEVERAETLLHRAHAMLPGDPHINANLGAVLVARGATAEARRCFGAAVAENPNIFPAWEGLADCAFLEGNVVEALLLLQEAREARLRCSLAVSQSPLLEGPAS